MLDVSHLTTTFDPVPGRRGRGSPLVAVSDVSFTLAAGETLGLVGESGSGKSMTALSILRLIPPPGRITAGSIRFKGRDLLTLSEAEMRQVRGADIALVFQEPSTALNPVYTVGDQIAEVLLVHGRAARKSEARTRAVELLDRVHLPHAAERARDYPHQLSGGQRQRVLIAMALACDPAVIIADEPTTALDVTIQAQILDLLREMRASLGLSLLLITHDLGVIAEIADRVAVMYAGRIVEHGPVREVLRRPQHPYTRALLASMPGRGGGRLATIDGVVPSLNALPHGCAFHPRCPERIGVCDHVVPTDAAVAADHGARCHLIGNTGKDVDAAG